MLRLILHTGWQKAVIARLSGQGQGIAVPDGGGTARAFNRALFLLCGRLARLDGQVTPAAIRNSTRLMGLIGLDPAQRQLAIEWFNEGKSPSAPVIVAASRLMMFIGRRSTLARLFLKTLADAASLDGGIGVQQRVLLREVAEIGGFTKPEFESLCLDRMPYGEYHNPATTQKLSHAYHVLELSPGVGEREIKRAYLRLVSRHHPDKLNPSNQSEEAVKQAHEQFASIRNAYELLRGRRKLRA